MQPINATRSIYNHKILDEATTYNCKSSLFSDTLVSASNFQSCDMLSLQQSCLTSYKKKLGNQQQRSQICKLEGKYSLESTDPCKSEIHAPPQPLPYLMPIPPNTFFL